MLCVNEICSFLYRFRLKFVLFFRGNDAVFSVSFIISVCPSDVGERGEVNIPLLVVGTKVDEANGSRLPLHNRRHDIVEIHLNCNDKSSIGPGTRAATKLS